MAGDGTNDLTKTIIGGSIEVHRALGPGLLESAYQACLRIELECRGLAVQTEVPVPLVYRGVDVSCVYRADMIVNDRIIVEIKAVSALTDVHVAQVLTYLRLLKLPLALLLNFNATTMVRGIRRLINTA